MKNIFLILLGCNITSLLMDRVMTSINFIETNLPSLNKITWYLSGGIKYTGDLSEAYIMKQQLTTLIENKKLDKNITYNYVLDELSKNTAENFYRISYYLNQTQIKYDDIYIITSKFHHNRANLMVSLIDPSRKYEWILGDLQQPDSLYWESVHIVNVYNDIYSLNNIKIKI